jgi:hypothetical protein
MGFLFYAVGRPEAAVGVLAEVTSDDPSDTLAAKLLEATKTAKPVERATP